MIKDQQISPKLSKRFSDLLGVDELSKEISSADGPSFLYLEESRKLSLNKLLHLAPYSEVLLLLGAQAVGRTTLLKAFVERAASTWRISFVTANALMDGETFLSRIAAGFGLKIDDIDSIEGLMWEIERYLQALGRSGRRAIIIIDDAHLLTDDVILLMEKILSDERTKNSVSLVMSMRKDQGSKLNRFTLLKKRLAYTLEIEPFNRKEVEGYLRQRLARAAIDHESVLTAELIDEILQKSKGIPEEINVQMHGVLAQMKKSAPSSSSGGRPLLKGAMLLVLVAVVATVLYYQKEINQMLALPEQADVEMEEQPAATQSTEKLEATPDQLARLNAETEKQEAAPMPLEDAEGQPVPVIQLEEALQTQAEETLPATDEAGLSQELVAGAPLPEFTPEDEAPPQAVTPLVTKPVVVVLQPQPQPKKQVKPEASPAQLSPQLEWLMAQPDQSYTMQLMAVADRSKVEGLAKKWNITDQSAVFPITRRGKVLTVLVYGSYPNLAAAEKAAGELPKSWRVGQPWLRTFSSVRKDLPGQ